MEKVLSTENRKIPSPENLKVFKFKPGDWVEIEDKALGLRSIGIVVSIVHNVNFDLFYSVDWRINECSKSQNISPTSLYPLEAFEKKATISQKAQVLYGSKKEK